MTRGHQAVFSINPVFSQEEKASAPGGIAPSSAVEKGLRAASDRFYAALNAMFTGDLAPMNAIWSHGDDVTDMGPFGGRLTGWKVDQGGQVDQGGRAETC